MSNAPLIEGYPRIEGYTVESRLGGGGFADVYLCRDQSLTRQVAVKVLRGSSHSFDERRAFEMEANAMAQLSHPHIAVIHGATVAHDGRPALVMAYLPGGDLAKRYLTEQIPVDEVLRIGIHIADAVEVAHRAGILHGDIKPANILTTESGKPVLSDFGIASFRGQDPALSGLSLPWSPVEVIKGAPNEVRSDVYSLAATIYAMLAGRSPFEMPGGPNDAEALLERICHSEVTPTGNPDAPEELEAILARSLSRNLDERAQTALEFARQLQSVQLNLGLAVSEVDSVGYTSVTRPGRVSRGLPTDPDQTARRRQGTPGPVNDSGLDKTGRRRDPAPSASQVLPLGDSSNNAGASTGSRAAAGSGEAAVRPAGRGALTVIGACCAAAFLAVGAWLFWPDGAGGLAPSDASQSGGSAVVDPNVDSVLEPPADLTIAREEDPGTAVARWTQPADWRPGDWYVWRVTRSGMSSASQRVAKPTARIRDVGASEALCVLVSHRRDAAASPFVQKCIS